MIQPRRDILSEPQDFPNLRMTIAFDRFTLDSEARRLLEGGLERHLSPRAFDVLEALIHRRPAVVSKAELQERFWPDTYVVDATLNVVIAEIRRVLGDDPSKPRFIRTVHRVGYAFCGATTTSTPAEHVQGSRCWVVWNERTVQLAEGENVIGRDPRSAVWVDASGVSRRHARIVVADADARLDDLGSKNGTFVGRAAVTSVRQLADGDVIHVGSASLKFRMWSDERAPQTERLGRERRRDDENAG
jgi:DNA-binding winged helix-turn-helix (wHTH) protein